MKTASFTVRATEKQSLRWKRAADAEGHASVGTWLAEAADRFLDALQRAGKPVPLGWRRCAVFAVRTPCQGELRVSGSVSHPFGYYRGTDARADRYNDFFTLVFLPSGRIIATLRSAAQCRTLAAELARVWVRWGGEEPAEDPAPLLQRFQREDV
jgi:hypothetical protein